jgi:predicted nucleic acid-binding protein
LSFVVDASIALAWCSKDEHTAPVLTLLEHARTVKLHVPAIWPVEVANVLSVMRRKNRLSQLEVAQAQALLDSLDIKVHEPRRARDVASLAFRSISNGLTAYDSEYLALATVLGLPIATLDGDLRHAAVKASTGVL